MYNKIKEDMIKALKSGDKFRLSVIRMAKGAIDKVRIDQKIEITDDVVISILAKEVKSRNDAKSEFMKAKRSDLVESLDKEIAILKEYLPEEMSDDEAVLIIDDAIKEVKASSIKDMGAVMGVINPKLKGRYDMKKASNLVREKLK